MKAISTPIPILLIAFPVLFAAQNVSYTVRTAAGTNSVGDGGPAAAALFAQPEGLAVDAGGNIYVSDAADCRIRKFSVGGMINTVAGTGIPDFSGDGGKAVTAAVNAPYGIALDSSGNLYFADLGNARVRKISTDGKISTVAGGGVTLPSPSSDGTPATAMKLSAPRNLAIDRDGNLYISDFNAHRIYQVAPTGLFYTVAGTGTAGYAGDNAPAKVAQLSSPSGLAVDSSGTLYIADSGNGRVRKVTKGVISTFFTIGSPTGLTIGPSGTLYVAAANYFGTSAHAVGAGILARDVAADAVGNLFVTSTTLVRRLGIDGSLTIAAGSGASRYYGGDGGPAPQARFHDPSSVAFDDLRNMYIADTGNNRIRRVDSAGVTTTFAGTGVAGAKDTNGTALLAQLNAPRGVAVDSLRNLYIADSGNNRVCKVTPSGIISVLIDKLNDPEAVALDPSDNVYVADTGNNRVLKISPSGVSATLTEVLHPTALTTARDGTLYIAESVRVSSISPAGNLAVVVDQLLGPRGLALLLTGELLVAEANANRIRVVGAAGATLFAGTGSPGFSGDGGPAVAAQFYGPSGLAVDPSGQVWVADVSNQRIRVLSADAAAIAAPLTQAALVNAASLATGVIAPEEIVTLFGRGFDDQTQLLVNGTPASIFYASPTQINALIPSATKAGTNADIIVTVQGAPIAEMLVPVVMAVPGIFALSGNQAAVLNQDGSVNSAANPAARGSVISLFATGWSENAAGVSLTVAGYPADILYAGPAPGYLGLKQVNARVPGGFLPPGVSPVVLNVGQFASQSGLTIAVN